MNKNFKNITSSRDNQSGVSMLEFAIVIPVLLLIVFAYIDFTRYRAIHSMLETSANRALTLASTIPGLDGDPSKVESGFVNARKKVLDKAREFAVATVVSDVSVESSAELQSAPELHMVKPDGTLVLLDEATTGDKSLRQMLEKNPLHVQLTAKYKPIIPFLPDLNIVATAVGFREPRSGVSLPIPVDCDGKPIGSDDYFGDCTCGDDPGEGDNSVWDSNTKQCKPCPDGTYSTYAEGRFKPGEQLIKSFKGGFNTELPAKCFCPSDKECQEGNAALGIQGVAHATANKRCKCECDNTYGWKKKSGSNECICQYSTATVVKETVKTLSGAKKEVERCRCEGENKITSTICNDPTSDFVKSKPKLLDLINKGIRLKGVNNSCDCGCANNCGTGAASRVSVNKGCLCSCKEGFKLENNVCVCDETGREDCPAGAVRNTDTCACECKNTCKGGDNTNPENNACVCRCPGGALSLDGLCSGEDTTVNPEA